MRGYQLQLVQLRQQLSVWLRDPVTRYGFTSDRSAMVVLILAGGADFTNLLERYANGQRLYLIANKLHPQRSKNRENYVRK